MRVETLRWQQSDLTNVAGFNVYVSPTPGSYGPPIPVGMATLEAGAIDIYFYDLVVADGEAVYVVVTAYSGTGQESVVSNERFLPACVADADCSDGDVCTGDEFCVGGSCSAGTALYCSVSSPCQSGTCDSQLGCLTQPFADGTICDDGDVTTVGDVCQAGACVGESSPPPPECVANADCSDGDVCTGDEFCVGGSCSAGTALYCSVSSPCQSGTCASQLGCLTQPFADGTICDDGDVTTVGDVCQAGTCIGQTERPEPCETRTQIGRNSSVGGTLTTSDCAINIDNSRFYVDLYEVSLPGDGWLSIAMDSTQIDSYVEIDPLDLSQTIAADNDSGSGLDALLTTHLDAGTYVIASSSFEPEETGSYGLTAILWLDMVSLTFVNPGTNSTQQSFLRLVNTAATPTDIEIQAFDDDGFAAPGGTVDTTLDAFASLQLTAQDLEQGNAAKGIFGSLGDGTGKWQLAVRSNGSFEAMSLIRTPDGFLTSVNDVVPKDGTANEIFFANPASNQIQQSFLRFTNQSDVDGFVTLSGVDDNGTPAPGTDITFSLFPKESRPQGGNE